MRWQKPRPLINFSTVGTQLRGCLELGGWVIGVSLPVSEDRGVSCKTQQEALTGAFGRRCLLSRQVVVRRTTVGMELSLSPHVWH